MITNIQEIENPDIPKMKPIKECMNIFIQDIPTSIPNRNGFIYCCCGPPGSGKSSFILNLFKNKHLYRGKFDNIFYFCPESSFLSVEKHPFEKHDKIYHELTVENLESIYDQVVAIKSESECKNYNLVLLDDFANELKNPDIIKALSKFLVKTRQLQTAFIFTLQSFYLCPKQLRKLISNLTLFKPKNYSEWTSISDEIFNLSKDDGLKLYRYVFSEEYSHLDVDLANNVYYKNFNQLVLTYKDDPIEKADRIKQGEGLEQSKVQKLKS